MAPTREAADAEARLNSAALAAAANGVMITDVEGKIVSVNAAFTRLTGYSAEEAIGRDSRLLRSGEMAPEYYRELWETILAGRVFSGEVKNRRKDGTIYVEEQTITPVPGPDGRPTHFVAIKQDVTRRREDEEALRAAKLAAEDATLAKSRFLAAMSHEIRTPMNAVIGVAELLLDTALDERQRELLETLRQSGEGLLSLIDEILDFSKVEAGRLDLVCRPFDPSATLEERLQLLAPRAHARGVELTCRISPEVPASLLGDEQRFGQVVVNLAGNALKFTEAGSVEVSLDPSDTPLFRADLTPPAPLSLRGVVAYPEHMEAGEGGGEEEGARSLLSALSDPLPPLPVNHRLEEEAAPRGEGGRGGEVCVEREGAWHTPRPPWRGVLAIRDTGVGIPAPVLPRLFEPFEQGDSSSRRRFKGTGLGLAISRRIAAAMGGNITAESAGLGRGATFRFVFAAPIVAPPAEVDPALHGARALLLGQRPAGARALVEQLGAWGMHATAAARLADLEPGEAPQVAILGPARDGWGADLALQLQEALRGARGHAGRIPVVLLCAGVQRGVLDPELARAGGIVSWLSAPARSAALRRALAAAVQGEAPASAAPSRPARRSSRGHRAPQKILVVEDDPVNQMVFCRMLEGLGHRASLAADGGAALALAAREPFDLIFMDVQLPGLDGVEATRILRARPPLGLRPPRIVAVTSNAFPEDRRRCLDAGMDDFLPKPVRRADLAAALDRADRASVPSTRAPPAPPLLDPGVLAEAVDAFCATPGDAAELFRTLLANAGALVDGVERALAEGDRSELRRHAHSLKSNARMFGLGPLGDACAAIEDLASGSVEGDPAVPVAGLRELFARSCAALVAGLPGAARS